MNEYKGYVATGMSGVSGYFSGNFVALARGVNFSNTSIKILTGSQAIPNSSMAWTRTDAVLIPDTIYGLRK